MAGVEVLPLRLLGTPVRFKVVAPETTVVVSALGSMVTVVVVLPCLILNTWAEEPLVEWASRPLWLRPKGVPSKDRRL